jgi:pimeloyl-ACP methyl ester carboxylesterase
MLEALEPRQMFSVDTSTVALYSAAGAPATIDAHKSVWFVFHGLAMSKDDMQPIGAAVQAQIPDAQVLLVDWSALADPSVANTVRKQLDNAWATADWVAAKVKALGMPSSRVNMIGFSMGGQAEDRLALDLKKRSAQVNRIIAIDPSAPGVTVTASGHKIRQIPTFADESAYSIAFSGADGPAFYRGALSADDAIVLTGLPADDMQRHLATYEAFTTMMQRDAGFIARGNDQVSGIFSIQNILTGNLPGWRKDAYDPGYEATLQCEATGYAWPEEYGPFVLAYVNRRAHTMHVRGYP